MAGFETAGGCSRQGPGSGPTDPGRRDAGQDRFGIRRNRDDVRTLTRRESSPTADLSSALISKIFELKVGDVATGRSGGDDGEVLLVVSEIKPVDLSKRTVEVQDLRDEVKQQIADDIAAQLTGALRTKVGVSIDQDAVDALF